MIKYALHPGEIKSKIDGDIYYISSGQLIRLYQVKPNECILWENAEKEYKEYIHLYPSYEGNYNIKELNKG